MTQAQSTTLIRTSDLLGLCRPPGRLVFAAGIALTANGTQRLYVAVDTADVIVKNVGFKVRTAVLLAGAAVTAPTITVDRESAAGVTTTGFFVNTFSLTASPAGLGVAGAQFSVIGYDNAGWAWTTVGPGPANTPALRTLTDGLGILMTIVANDAAGGSGIIVPFVDLEYTGEQEQGESY